MFRIVSLRPSSFTSTVCEFLYRFLLTRTVLKYLIVVCLVSWIFHQYLIKTFLIVYESTIRARFLAFSHLTTYALYSRCFNFIITTRARFQISDSRGTIVFTEIIRGVTPLIPAHLHQTHLIHKKIHISLRPIMYIIDTSNYYSPSSRLSRTEALDDNGYDDNHSYQYKHQYKHAGLTLFGTVLRRIIIRATVWTHIALLVKFVYHCAVFYIVYVHIHATNVQGWTILCEIVLTRIFIATICAFRIVTRRISLYFGWCVTEPVIKSIICTRTHI
jgi:hypothetical protein